MKKKKKPLKNYVILGAILAATILGVIYLCLWYREYQEYEEGIPVLRGIIPEITEVELSHYVRENERAIVYLCVPSNKECRYFENDLKKMIIKEELKDKITYLNLSNDNHANVTMMQLTVDYQIKENLTNYPAFLLFENGKVIEVLQGTDTAVLSLGAVENFLNSYDVG